LRIEGELEHSRHKHHKTGRPTRFFADFVYKTRDSWSCSRHLVTKAEHLDKGANPRFVVTSLKRGKIAAERLYEKLYCGRVEMENRIKGCQLDLFADRTSTKTMAANQLRLWFAGLAYVLLCAVRRIGLAGASRLPWLLPVLLPMNSQRLTSEYWLWPDDCRRT